MSEVLPDGSISQYSRVCPACGNTVSCNIQGDMFEHYCTTGIPSRSKKPIPPLPPLRPVAKHWANPTPEELKAQKDWDEIYGQPGDAEQDG